MAELPTPGGDTGTWGPLLNNFLSVALNADGTPNPEALYAAIAADTSGSGISFVNNNNTGTSINIQNNDTGAIYIATAGEGVIINSSTTVGIYSLNGLEIINSGGGKIYIEDNGDPTQYTQFYNYNAGLQVEVINGSIAMQASNGTINVAANNDVTIQSNLSSVVLNANSGAINLNETVNFYTGNTVSDLVPVPPNSGSFGFTADGHIYFYNTGTSTWDTLI
jgi:hypothetical protein